ncbi:MAG: hypothetical protein IJY39_01540 [Clostridia bacterium]|nr:hypothetical protein [Clostridia bacterium]
MAKKTTKSTAKKPLIIATVCTGVAAVGLAFGKAFQSMKANAVAQHEVDRAEFRAVKAESKAHFEENRGRNTFKKAKAIGKQSWDDAHMSPSERAAKEQEARDARIADAKEREAQANARYDAARK